jgi:hypothetical protein
MIRPWQMTNEIISDTKVIFTKRNAAIQFTPAAGSIIDMISLTRLAGSGANAIVVATGTDIEYCSRRRDRPARRAQ